MTPPAGAVLAANIMHFARLLRRAGLPVGPAEAIAAQQAFSLIDPGNPVDARIALRTTMIHRREHQEIFDQAFALFWRDHGAARQQAIQSLLDARRYKPDRAPAGSRRLAEAFAPRGRHERPDEDRTRQPAALSVSDRERLQTLDFEAMSAEEIREAKSEIRRLALPLDLRRTRRLRPDPLGPSADLRRTIRASLRQGGEILQIARSRRQSRPPPLVVLCDISGSMSRYAQILLHFLHAVSNDRARVHVFLFGTRLSNITRQLRHRDPEAAFQLVAHVVPDWSGGTRIGEALHQFNRLWAKRVLGQGALVLLITDGLDRPREEDGIRLLADAMDRLHRSCRRLIWVNPLLRWAGFEPRSQGIRAMLPHVDEFRPIHNLASLRALVEVLSGRASPRRGRTSERTQAS